MAFDISNYRYSTFYWDIISPYESCIQGSSLIYIHTQLNFVLQSIKFIPFFSSSIYFFPYAHFPPNRLFDSIYLNWQNSQDLLPFQEGILLLQILKTIIKITDVFFIAAFNWVDMKIAVTIIENTEAY